MGTKKVQKMIKHFIARKQKRHGIDNNKKNGFVHCLHMYKNV